MKVHILGTGTSQGVPVIGCRCPVCLSDDSHDNRLRSCIVVEQDGTYLLIDTGPDMRLQMLRADIPRIDAILYTHEHNDHVIGLDDIRPYNFKQKEDLPIYGLPRVIDEVQDRFAYVFAEKRYPGAPQALAHKITGDHSFEVNGIEIIPIHITHGRLPILGYRIGGMAFITDASYIQEAELAKLQNLDVLIINALRHEQHPAHFNLSEALAVIADLGCKRAYITHVSHFMGLQKEWSKMLPNNVRAAYDGMTVRL